MVAKYQGDQILKEAHELVAIFAVSGKTAKQHRK
jgi:hypothetical protein